MQTALYALKSFCEAEPCRAQAIAERDDEPGQEVLNERSEFRNLTPKTIPERCSNKECQNHNPHKLKKNKRTHTNKMFV